MQMSCGAQAGSQELGRKRTGFWLVLTELDSLCALWCPNLSLLGHTTRSLNVTLA